MLAFEITVNGKRRYVAGHPDEQFLNVILWGNARFAPGASINTTVTMPDNNPSGLVTLSYPSERIGVGDEVTIRIVDVEAPDAPTIRNDAKGGHDIEIVASESPRR